ncbi:TPA: hypothetical protein ACKCH0_001812 [Streptococcus pneumoniae]|uniref:hypothetical protein n=1 Tax=Streptococcus pneumoniae TaxID=1313 RepID=UPI0005E7AB9F|nr:hypothetical protein [Streptococcus pneumoniae]CIR47748.1 Uncharacterised protein [Streptococcus pneumoniae]HEX1351910.1 hypothetical protein [Streptococcus pneumoniae]
METVNTILGIVGSIFGIIATAISFKNQNDIKKIIKNADNSQNIGNNSSNNVQNIGDGR